MVLKQHGFTLIELMVTLIIMAIVVLIALPGFSMLMRNNQAIALGEDFATALNIARSEAVKRGQPVVLCASNATQTNCGTDWANGWLIAPDPGAETATTTSVINNSALRVWSPPVDNGVITVQRVVSGTASATTFIRYSGMGTLSRIGNDATQARVTTHIEDCNGRAQQQITVGVAGSLRVARAACPGS